MSVQTRPGAKFICEVPEGHQGFFVDGPDACGDPYTYICAYREESDSLMVLVNGLGGKVWLEPAPCMRSTFLASIRAQVNRWHLAHPDYEI